MFDRCVHRHDGLRFHDATLLMGGRMQSGVLCTLPNYYPGHVASSLPASESTQQPSHRCEQFNTHYNETNLL